MKKPLYFNYLLPIWLGSFLSSSFTRLFFLRDFRWFMLTLILMAVALKRIFLKYLDYQLFVVIFAYFSWCVLTAFWSSFFEDSFIRSMVYMLVSMSSLCLGIEWVRMNTKTAVFDCFKVFTLISLLSAILGFLSDDSVSMLSGISLYRGLVEGANMLGFMLAMSFPYLFWRLYESRDKLNYQLIFMALILCSVIYLFQSLSRSAIIIFICIFLGFTIPIKISQKFILYFIPITLFMLYMLLHSSSFITISKRIIFKSPAAAHHKLLHTRLECWSLSYRAAEVGGLFGLGFGTSLARESLFSDVPSYAIREKCNSQLKAIEETGLIGFILYLILICTVIYRLIKLYRVEKNPSHQVKVGLLTGSIGGILIQSVVEAWWSSPGSLENLFFWILLGIMRGLGTFK